MKQILILSVICLFTFPSLGQPKDIDQLILTSAKRNDVMPSFWTKYYKSKAWNVTRSKPIPSDNEIWTLSNCQPAMDASTKKPIDWGVKGDRYVVISAVLDPNNRPYHVVDDILKTKNCITFTLNLYEFDGKFVKTISKWGYLIGDAWHGIVYVQEGGYATFLSNIPIKKGGSVTYKVIGAVENHLTNLLYEDEMIEVYRSGKVVREDRLPVQLACSFPPKPVFDAKKTAILDKMRQESPFLQAKFYQEMVVDAGRWDWPKPNQPWKFLNMAGALDIINSCYVDWGPKGDRYLQFDAEFENSRNYSALADDMYSTGKRFLFPLRLYENDGRFVKTVSNFGNFWGFGEGSFVYIQEVKNTNATFFTKSSFEFGKPFTYHVQKDKITKISELLNFKPAQ